MKIPKNLKKYILSLPKRKRKAFKNSVIRNLNKKKTVSRFIIGYALEDSVPTENGYHVVKISMGGLFGNTCTAKAAGDIDRLQPVYANTDGTVKGLKPYE